MSARHYDSINDDYRILHPESVRLRRALCEYTILMVELCTEIVKFMKKHPFVQASLVAFRSYKESTFTEIKEKLEDQKHIISAEVSCESAKLQKITQEKLSRSLCEITKLQHHAEKLSQEQARELESKRRLLKQQARVRFLDSCSTYTYYTALKQARRRGSVKWIFENEKYKLWVQEPDSILCCSGILGAGKSVLTASVIAALLGHGRGTIVAYFFCRYEDRESLRPETVIRSITRQVLQSTLINFEDLEYQQHESDEDQCLRLLHSIPRLDNPVYMLVDGLDECGETEASHILGFLHNVNLISHDIRIYYTSRPNLTPEVFKVLPPKHKINMAESTGEIATYIRNTLIDRLETGQLVLGDPEAIITKIMECLADKAQGMFLYASLQIDTICAQITDEDITRALECLPKGLPDTFDRILRNLDASERGNRSLATKIFVLVACAQRPLNLEELREAVSVEAGDKVWRPEKVLNDIGNALKCCGGLLVVDEEEDTVRFAHSSMRQYLHEQEMAADLISYYTGFEDREVLTAYIILTYLNYRGKFETQLIKGTESWTGLTKVTVDSPANPFMPKNKRMEKAARAIALLKGHEQQTTSLGQQTIDTFSNFGKRNNSSRETGCAFLSYASEFWFLHSRALHIAPTRVDALPDMFDAVAMGEIKIIKLPWAPEKLTDFGPKIMLCIAETRNWYVVKMALHIFAEQHISLESIDLHCVLQPWADNLPTDDPPYNVQKIFIQTLQEACTHSTLAIVEWLLTHRKIKDINAIVDERTVLEMAAFQGNLHIIELVLKAGANPNLQGPLYGGPLDVALAHEDTSTVELLRKYGACMPGVSDMISNKRGLRQAG